MSRLVDSLSRFFGRVEILARGAEEDRKAAELAQQKGHVLEARSHARALLAKVPGSPLGLALWADAAEQCWLDEEVVVALSQLVEQMPWRPEIWLRLGLAGSRSGWSGAREALQRAAAATDDPAVARSALLRLADQDLLADELDRAGRWLDRVPTHPSQPDPELALRRAECAMALGEADRARTWAKQIGSERADGRVRLVRARLAEIWPDEAVGADAVSLALAAHVLEAPGGSDVLARILANSRDAALVDRVRRVLRAAGEHEEPQWQAAFAMAEGRAADAREALLAGVRSGNALAARTLLSLATEQRDIVALRALAEHDAVSLSPGMQLLLDATDCRAQGRFREALDKLDDVAASELRGWAEQSLQELIATWVPDDVHEPADWNELLSQLRAAATEMERLDLIGPIESLAVERERPLFVAVLGEFNAGKSTFLNALLGTDVAPTGIRPTTASLHWVAWAPDPFARVVVCKGSDRVVPHAELKKTLQQLREEGAQLDRVFIYAPIERLKRIEVLDTPGFNAPDDSHTEQARRGIAEAHVALWLLDGTAPLKDSERQVIEQVASAGVPIQFLVNKRDRVGEQDIARVMSYVETALADVGIVSLAPPVALSAQQALAGRLGDEEALQTSNWAQVEAVLADHIVNRCDALRERALRRKAAHLAGALAAAAKVQAAQAQELAQQRQLRGEALRQLAARLRMASTQREAVADAVLDSLAPALRGLQADLRPLEAIEDKRRADPEIRAYLVSRTVERLVPVVVDAVVAQLDPEVVRADWLREPVRATFAGAAATQPRRLGGDALLATLDVALVACARALEREARIFETTAADASMQRRLQAIASAFSRPPSPPQSESSR